MGPRNRLEEWAGRVGRETACGSYKETSGAEYTSIDVSGGLGSHVGG